MNGEGYWIDRAGNTYSVGAYGHADFARDALHSQGLSKRTLEKIADPEDILLDRGWVRVSITGVWILTRRLSQAQIDALWDLAQQLYGIDDLMARRVMAALNSEAAIA